MLCGGPAERFTAAPGGAESQQEGKLWFETVPFNILRKEPWPLVPYHRAQVKQEPGSSPLCFIQEIAEMAWSCKDLCLHAALLLAWVFASLSD